ncbi:MAG: hypothetical protein ACI835_005826 [Planctomycetota bacterium]|jgi:hypothetical protein
MNSRVHPTYKTKYRVTNWAEYDQSLVQRGDITLWITPEAINAWTPKSSVRRGAPRMYSDLAIETALTLRLVFRLPLRQAEGFLRSLLDMMDLSARSTGPHDHLSPKQGVEGEARAGQLEEGHSPDHRQYRAVDSGGG